MTYFVQECLELSKFLALSYAADLCCTAVSAGYYVHVIDICNGSLIQSSLLRTFIKQGMREVAGTVLKSKSINGFELLLLE